MRGYYAYFGRYEVSATGDVITHFVEASLKPKEVGVAYQRAIRMESGRRWPWRPCWWPHGRHEQTSDAKPITS